MTWWAGVSFERGGEIVVGVDRAEGYIFDFPQHGKPIRYMKFVTETTSVGIGLGGSAGLNFLIGANIHTPMDLEDAGMDDGVGFSLDFGIAGTGKYLRSIPNYMKFVNDFKGGIHRYLYLAGHRLEFLEQHGKLKTIAENVLKNVDGVQKGISHGPALISVPLSTGLRLSLNYRFSITDVLESGAMEPG
jgi:hypothetical protein